MVSYPPSSSDRRETTNSGSSGRPAASGNANGSGNGKAERNPAAAVGTPRKDGGVERLRREKAVQVPELKDYVGLPRVVLGF